MTGCPYITQKELTLLTNIKTSASMKINLIENLPDKMVFRTDLRQAPDRGFSLSKEQTVVALKNALRYIPSQHHEAHILEFLGELKQHGRIYGYRYCPAGPLKAKNIDEYKGNCL
ncbi:MAG: hypothetical protein OCC45_15825 [Desulfotalea sp.]